MPWSCRSCNATNPQAPAREIPDDVDTCRVCGERKDTWTMAGGQTRVFAVKGKRFELFLDRTTGRRSRAEGWGTPSGLEHAERAVSVPIDTVSAWLREDADRLPPAAPTLLLRIWTGADVEVELRAEPAHVDEAHDDDDDGVLVDETTWRAPSSVDGRACREARYLFVHGVPRGDALPSFGDTVQVVDLTQGSGHAPRVNVAVASSPKKVVLPVDAWDKGWARRLECASVHFNVDSALLLPDGLDAVERALRHAYGAKGKDLLVVAGHTDSQDTFEKNLTLARSRCANVAAMLLPRAEGRARWAASAQASYLRLADKERTGDLVAGLDRDAVSGLARKRWPSAYTGFDGLYAPYVQKQTALHRSPGVPAGAGDGRWGSLLAWEAAYDLYEEALQARVRLRNAAEGLFEKGPTLEQMRGEVEFVDPAHPGVGCGELYLKVRGGGGGTDRDDDVDEVDNRRIEFLFFPADTPPWRGTQTDDDAGERSRRLALYGASDRELVGGRAVEGVAPWDYQTNDGPWCFDALPCCDEEPLVAPDGDTVFVIDVTDSMKSTAEDPVRGRTRMAVCKELLTRTLLALPPGGRFAMVAFAQNAYVWTPSHGALAEVTDDNVIDALGWVAGLSHRSPKYDTTRTTPVELFEGWDVNGNRATWRTRDGETNVGPALQYALETYPGDSVVLLTDGVPTMGVENEVRIVEETRLLQEALAGSLPPTGLRRTPRRIHTYGFLGASTLIAPAQLPAAEQAYVAALTWTPLTPVPWSLPVHRLAYEAPGTHHHYRSLLGDPYAPRSSPVHPDLYLLTLEDRQAFVYPPTYLAATGGTFAPSMAGDLETALLGWFLRRLAEVSLVAYDATDPAQRRPGFKDVYVELR